MSKKFSLQPLVNLAQQQYEAATRKFGQLNQQMQAAQIKLETLLQYRKDYQIRFQEAEQKGMSQSEMRNFREFILRLDEAIAQQRHINEQTRSLMEAGRIELLEAQRKMKSFDTLAQRHIESSKKLESQSEQRQQDEHTNHFAAIKIATTQTEH